jgi:hypothetical protein
MLSPSQVSVTGSVRRQVTCESCGHAYNYEMSRTASGSYHGFAWNDAEGQRKALPEAQEALRQQLETECDVVPCPKCGALTREMQEEEVSTVWSALGLAVLGAGVSVVAWFVVWNYAEISWLHGRSGLVIFLCLLGVGGLAVAVLAGFGFLAGLTTLLKKRNGWGLLVGFGQSPVPPRIAGGPVSSPGVEGARESGLPVPGAPLQEDKRSLREFYPDPEMRYHVHYGFVHRFLAPYVYEDPRRFFAYLFRQDVPGGPMEPTRFVQSRWALYERVAGLVERKDGPWADLVFRRVTDLDLTLHQVAGHPVALVRMPTPEGPLQAFLVAVMLLGPADAPEQWPADARARLFTLEAEVEWATGCEMKGVVCERTDVSHKFIGLKVRAETEPFLKAVAAVLEMEENR